MITFIVPGELTDLNTYINAERINRFKAAKIKKEETEKVAWLVKKQKIPKITKKMGIMFIWYMKNGRKDVDNIAFSKKFILDGLVLAGVLPDDSQKYIGGMGDLPMIDKENPRVEVVFV